MSIKENIDVDAGTAYQGLGAYAAASNIATAQTFEAGYAAALEMGLEGTAATQYANAAAEGAELARASTVGKWLPWIGAGLAVYDWASGDITGESTVQLGATLATMAVLALGVVTIPAAVSSYMMAQGRAHSENYVRIVESSLELVHKDENGNYYLRGLNSRDNTLNPCDPTADSSCQETYLRYNPANNTLENVVIDRPAKSGYLENPASGTDLEGAEWGEFDPVLWTIDSDDITTGDDTVAWMVNMPSLQAQIYNQVLLPEGLAPLPDTTPINLNGKEYYQDSAEVVYRSNGQIVGMYNEETGGVESFISSCDPNLGCRLYSDNRIDITHNPYGTISDSPAYILSDDFVTIGMGPQATNANPAAWLDGTQPNADFVTPHITDQYEEGITSEQYAMLDQTGYVRLGAEHNPDNEIQWGGGETGYTIDTATGDLLYNGAIVGRTQITEDRYVYTAGERGQRVPEGEGWRVYAAFPLVWDLDGNMLGRIEISYDGHIALEINPELSEYYEGNEARRNDPSIDPNTFNHYYTLQGDEDPSIFSWDTVPNYPEGTLGIPSSPPSITADTPVAHITLPGQPSGLLLTPETSEPEPSPFATPGTWDPTANAPAPATPAPTTTADPPSSNAPGGLLSSTPPVANITLPQRSLSGSAGLLSKDTRQPEPSPFTAPGTWDPTIPVPSVANITLPGTRR